MRRKLFRSKKEKIVAGVLAGIARYYQVDATLVRIIFIVLLSFSGFLPGILAYVIAAIVIPAR
jgi:phage shock protein C